jgi:hypothetical protein
MRWFEQVNHLVNDNVFEILPRLSSEIATQSDRAGAVMATPRWRESERAQWFG